MWVTVVGGGGGGAQQFIFGDNPLLVNYEDGTYTSSRELSDAEAARVLDNMDKTMMQ